MKITDDHEAKYKLWARNPRVMSTPPPVHLPNFKSRRFASHSEMNEWKRSVLKERARLAGER
jgi:hypothetical protein